MALGTAGRDTLMASGGALALLAVLAVVWHYRGDLSAASDASTKARRVEIVRRMELGIALASEAEKSAVMAVTDEDSRAYADESRRATDGVENARVELAGLLRSDGSRSERERLG